MVLSLFLSTLPVVVLTRRWFVGNGEPGWRELRHAAFIAGESLLVLGTTAIVTAAFWWTRRHGLSLADGARLLFGATSPPPARGQSSFNAIVRRLSFRAGCHSERAKPGARRRWALEESLASR